MPIINRNRLRQITDRLLTIAIIFLMFISEAPAYELSGYIAAEGRGFVKDPLYSGQERDNASIAIQPELYHEFKNGSSITFVPFGRVDSADDERTHFDIRELNFLYLADNWEARIGIGKVYWGVTESVHLVDIINQTDFVESFDGEEKLGQPMVTLSAPTDWGTFDFFVLPYFRERTFPGKGGRLRPGVAIDADNAAYENSSEERHVDYAVRYSNSIGDWEVGLSHFYGTGREPNFNVSLDEQGDPTLAPYYEIINQSGLDLQLITGSWLWKLESIYRTGQGDPFLANAFGFEYTFVGVMGTSWDIGILAEWIRDNRDDKAPATAFQNDIMAGARITPNDAEGTEILLGMFQDLDHSATVITLEASRRIGSGFRVYMEMGAFVNMDEDDLLYGLRDDGYVRLELMYYY